MQKATTWSARNIKHVCVCVCVCVCEYYLQHLPNDACEPKSPLLFKPKEKVETGVPDPGKKEVRQVLVCLQEKLTQKRIAKAEVCFCYMS